MPEEEEAKQEQFDKDPIITVKPDRLDDTLRNLNFVYFASD